MRISGWGRYPVIDAVTTAPRCFRELTESIQRGNAIARGNGRAYGDSAISERNTIEMKHFNRMLAFDPATGQLVAQAGVLLADVIDTFLPRGWFPSVTPGTKFVTLGGMVAADVHGKNHHKDGSFGSCIDWIDIVTSSGEVKRCSNENSTDLFNWTIGGMGLTGIILNVAFRLKPIKTSWIKQKSVIAENIEHAIDIFENTLSATYSVAWIDCMARGSNLGRSIVMLGEHAEIADLSNDKKDDPFVFFKKKKVTIPFNLPSFSLNRITVRLFNLVYYWNAKRNIGSALVDWDSYFYPLDSLLGWNKIYGRKGFAQFQCVLPLEQSNEGLQELLEAISKAGAGSFLAVLKRFGCQDSLFSFPMEGYTLALDFPISKRTLHLMNQLDEITIRHKGRFYLAKDSRMTESTFKKTESRLENFKKFKDGNQNNQVFSSEQSKRLDI